MAMAAEETNQPEQQAETKKPENQPEGKKPEKQPEAKKPEKEGANLLGKPKFTKLPNGRFKCVQTGHELLAKDKESYSQSKRCRLGLIDYALSNGKAPLNMFDQDPDSRSKLICKLTGDKVNKSEEHIWKHMSGKRFLIKLEQEEEEKQKDGFDIVTLEEANKDSSKKKKKKKDKKKKDKIKKEKDKEKGKEKITDEADSEVVEGSVKNRDTDEEFWMPPEGERWDFDDGGDRWGSDDESEQENEDEALEEDGSVEDDSTKSEEIPTKKKRKSVEVGADDSASKKRRKKKKKKKSKKAKNTSNA